MQESKHSPHVILCRVDFPRLIKLEIKYEGRRNSGASAPDGDILAIIKLYLADIFFHLVNFKGHMMLFGNITGYIWKFPLILPDFGINVGPAGTVFLLRLCTGSATGMQTFFIVIVNYLNASPKWQEKVRNIVALWGYSLGNYYLLR